MGRPGGAGSRVKASGKPRVKKWSGGLDVGLGWALYLGPVGTAETHRHLALQLTIASGPDLKVRLNEGAEQTAEMFLIDRHVPHLLLNEAEEIFSLYVDPTSKLGRALRTCLGGEPWRSWVAAPLALHPIVEVVGGRRPVSTPELLGAVEGWANIDVSTTGDVDGRILRATRIINDDLTKAHSLISIARAVGLSESRLSALFRRDLGMAFRAYVTWARLVAAVTAIAAGASATKAAHAAGFADQAHFSRTFKRLYGTTPSASLLVQRPGGCRGR